MMEKGLNLIPTGGKNRNGMPKQETSHICKVCGKEGLSHHIKNHIEANHLEGLSIPCNYCDTTCSSRKALETHRSKFHK